MLAAAPEDAPSIVETDEILLASLASALGAVVHAVHPGGSGKGAVVLGLGGITAERLAVAAERLAGQIRGLESPVTLDDLDLVVGNTLLGDLFAAHGRLRKQILSQTRKRR